MGRLTIPVATLPLWILAVAGFVMAGLLLVYWGGLWAQTAQVFFRTTLTTSVYLIMLALVIGAPDAAVAASLGRFLIPLEWLRAVAVVEAFLRITNVRVGPWYRWLWYVGLIGLAVSCWPGGTRFYPVVWTPGGLYGLALYLSPLGVLRDLIAGSQWTLVASLLVRNYRRRPTWRHLVYAWAIWLALPLVIGGVAWTAHSGSNYPAAWVGTALLLAALWVELSAEVQNTYRGLSSDPLTAAHSRRYSLAYAQEVLRTRSLGVLYLDVDDFKQYNDRLGHDGGDSLLTALAYRIRQVLGPDDIVGRMGGDEFLILIPGAHRTDGWRWTSRIRAAVSGDAFAFAPDREALDVQVSLGWSFGVPGSDVRTLIDLADQAMYDEKRLHHRESRTVLSEG